MNHRYYITVLFPIFTTLFATSAIAAEKTTVLKTIVVTATREAKPKSEVAESVTSFNKEQIVEIAPSHPAELLNRIAGVHINNLGGEGHMTAIRQPLTTSGVYLFLEDGIPTRPTGFFNHNGLYEVNIPQAGGIEVTRGPGSALYGSDAIGGIINTLTAAPPESGMAKADLEIGTYGWKRALVSAGTSYAPNAGVLANINVTDSEGFRRHADYERQSLNLRWDTPINTDTQVKTVLAWSQIDQTGVSGILKDDYKKDSRINYFTGDIGRREVYAVRLSSEFAIKVNDADLVTVTPFYRDNQMDLMPYWTLGYDPQQYTTAFQSYGLLTKYRHNFDSMNAVLITGIDMDSTPSTYEEDQISVSKIGRIYTGFTKTGRTNYDFDATQKSISPYIHTEWQLAEDWRASLGIRYDYFTVKYHDNLDASVAQTIGFGKWFRPDDQSVSYDQFSPKAGLIYTINDKQDVYANIRHAFRAPTAGQLFRSGSSVNTDKLDAVSTNSIELGYRAVFFDWLNYETALYRMVTKNDIVSYLDATDRKITNAGETHHQGIEISLGGDVTDEWGFNVAFSYTQQTYEDFSYISGATTLNYAGNDIMQAPKTMGNAVVSYQPDWLRPLRLEAEIEHLGRYYLDQTNTDTYGGHNIINLRGSYQLSEKWEVYSRLENLTNKRYSTSTGFVTPGAEEYRPGQPLSAFIGVRYEFE